ncbi:LuxR C-terminal-related transcriptional regulator [Labrys portucalensis]|uniref:LuxR C-terminal-related transcriptional regulator n=1 Tax=Labrys neptuniae TaxID=376174 RepID=A0ABV3PM83_9HYPH|nr:response regulator transcription factor [Labrys neptuniae]MDT3380528.1 response regulator transcription factor [Labrys neptuniae]
MTLSSSASRKPIEPVGDKQDVAVELPLDHGASAPVAQIYRDASAHIVVICANTLTRTCLMHCLTGSETGLAVEGYADVEQWGRQGQGASVALLCVTGVRETTIAVERMVRRVLAAAPGIRVVVISDTRSAGDVAKALEHGASGFIAMDSNVDVAIAAIRLVRSGGMFVPSHSVMQSRTQPAPLSDGRRSLRDLVTAKQLEVIGLIRKGLPNKAIAAELEMSEFTVKVHVRNIMKRLNARNRTEVVALTNAYFGQMPEQDDHT